MVQARFKKLIGYGLIAVWLGATSLLLTTLVANHSVAFADQTGGELPAKFLAAHGASDQWRALHVLASGCACSSDVLSHLLSRGPNPLLSGGETVIFLGHDAKNQRALTQAGFRYVELSPELAVEQTGVEAAPMMALVDPAGKVRYLGGYYRQRERTQALDQETIQKVYHGDNVAPLPAFGCAISHRLQAVIDPLGVKY